MKKIKSIIIILGILIVIIVIILIIIIRQNTNEADNLITDSEYEEAEQNYAYIEEIEDYLKVKKCVNSYLSVINIENSAFYGYDENSNYVNLMSDEDINSYMYEVLSEEYINKNSINTSNIRNYVYEIEEDCFFIPLEMVYKGETENVKAYGVYGLIETQDFEPMMECYLIVNIDSNNNTYSIEQLESREEISTISVSVPDEIEEKDNNVFSELGLVREELIQEYINDFKRLALAYPEVLYDQFLDEEYRDKKFGSLESFEEYISQNEEEIESINPTEYQVTEYDEYTQYFTIDQNGNYYFFNSTTPGEYKIILDTYTIDLPQFTETYNSATDQQKVALNIDKFIKAINEADYKYAYNCLADSYKENYFNTQEEFETYVEENFYTSSTVTYNEFSTQGEYYTYSVTLTNDETEEQMTKTFIVQLGEETEFVLSFDR